jgi:stage III sporulation protein AC
MDIEVVLRVAGIGMIVAVVTQILGKIGRDEQATMVSIAGIVMILLLLVDKIGELILLVTEVFGL